MLLQLGSAQNAAKLPCEDPTQIMCTCIDLLERFIREEAGTSVWNNTGNGRREATVQRQDTFTPVHLEKDRHQTAVSVNINTSSISMVYVL